MLVQKLRVSFYIEQRWRVVNFAEQLGVLRLVPTHEATFGRFGLRQFLGGRAQGLPRMNRLRYGGRELVSFERGERSVEDGVRAAECAQQFPSHARAEPRRERERQPSQVLVGLHCVCGEPTHRAALLSSMTIER